MRRVVGAAGCAFAVWIVLAVPVLGEDPPSDLTILHINDLHGWILPHPSGGGANGEEGGLARMAALAAAADASPRLFLAAGDLMQGTNLSNHFRGRPVIEALGIMGLDASALGNHDFDYGLETLRRRASEAPFPFLAANIRGEGLDFLKAYVVRKAGPYQVALFGLTTAETPITTHPDNVRGLSFLPPAEVAKDLMPELRRRADVVVCLSHLGLEEDMKLAAAVPEIDVIVGGHTHTRLEKPLWIGSTVVVQAYERGAVLGLLKLEIEREGIAGFQGSLLPVDGSAGEDARVAEAMERYRREAEGKLGEVIGTAAVDLVGERSRIRTGETNLGSLVADAVRAAASTEAAIVNGGAIRGGIPAGEVTAAHLYNALPFDTYVVAFELTAKEVREVLESALARVERMGGGFPQVSGMSYSFDSSAPPGSRVREVRIGGALLREGGKYTVAANDFLAAGGDGYGVLPGKKPLSSRPGRFLRDVLADYWRDRGEIRGTESPRVTETGK